MTFTLSPDDIIRCRAINMRTNDRVKEIALAVCAETSIPISAIYGRNRKANVAEARWIIMRIAYDQGMSYEQIGRALNRDHTTVIYGIKQERKLRAESETPAN